MFIYEKQFREDNPQTVGEQDPIFDLDNYKDWLEEKLEQNLEAIEEICDDLDSVEMNINSTEYKIWQKLNNLLKKFK